MKLTVLTLALTATALGSLSAAAQTTIIEERRAPVVIEERRGPPVVIQERRSPPVIVEERRGPPAVVVAPAPTVETQSTQPILGGVQSTTTRTESVGAGVDCTTRTVQNNTLLGSNSTTTRSCD